MIPNRIKDSQLVFKATRFEVKETTYLLQNGETVKKEFIAHPGAVLILPLVDKDTILLIRNYRFAINETLYELPAGTRETGEEPLKTAARELEEETGYTSDKITPLFYFYTTPGFCNEKMFVFSAENLVKTCQHLDESEEITVEKIALEKAISMIYSGEIKDGKTISTLLFFKARIGTH